MCNFSCVENSGTPKHVYNYSRAGTLSIYHGNPVLRDICVDTEIGDEGLAAIGSMPHITGLRMPSRLRVTDAGLANISGLRLAELDLQDFVNITDDGLLALRPMAPYLYVRKKYRPANLYVHFRGIYVYCSVGCMLYVHSSVGCML